MYAFSAFLSILILTIAPAANPIVSANPTNDHGWFLICSTGGLRGSRMVIGFPFVVFLLCMDSAIEVSPIIGVGLTFLAYTGAPWAD